LTDVHIQRGTPADRNSERGERNGSRAEFRHGNTPDTRDGINAFCVNAPPLSTAGRIGSQLRRRHGAAKENAG
jgi:hypothetical protein